MKCINENHIYEYGPEYTERIGPPLYACECCSALYAEDLPACVGCQWCTHPEVKEVSERFVAHKYPNRHLSPGDSVCMCCGAVDLSHVQPTEWSRFGARPGSVGNWLRNRHAKQEAEK